MNPVRPSAARWIAFCFCAATIRLGFAAPATKPTTQASPVNPATTRTALDIAVDAHTELAAAILSLQREYTQHQHDPHSPVRTSSTYFQDQPTPDVSEDAIADRLDFKFATDARADAYVKWQLLSGIASPPKDRNAPKLLAAYRAAATPAVLPGIDAATRQTFERERTLIVHDEDVDNLDKDIHNQQDDMIRANATIIAYRNELFAKLPPTYDTLAVGLQDVNMRLNAGADLESIETPLVQKISKWMEDPKALRTQKISLAAAIEHMADEKVPYIAGAQWNAKKRQAQFQDKYITLNTKNTNAIGRNKLIDLAKNLRIATGTN